MVRGVLSCASAGPVFIYKISVRMSEATVLAIGKLVPVLVGFDFTQWSLDRMEYYDVFKVPE